MTVDATHLTRRYAVAAMQGHVRKIICSPDVRVSGDAFFTAYAPMLAADGTQLIVSPDLMPEDVIFMGGPFDDDSAVH